MAKQRIDLPLDAHTRAAMAALPYDQRERLEALINKSVMQQRGLLEQAVEDAMGVVPSPLRKRLLKMLFK